MDFFKGAAIAAAVASLLTAAGCGEDSAKLPVGGASDALKCQGGNECKGHSECASAEGKNECQGMNECKGMGWVSVDTAQQCEELGGEIAG